MGLAAGGGAAARAGGPQARVVILALRLAGGAGHRGAAADVATNRGVVDGGLGTGVGGGAHGVVGGELGAGTGGAPADGAVPDAHLVGPALGLGQVTAEAGNAGAGQGAGGPAALGVGSARGRGGVAGAAAEDANTQLGVGAGQHLINGGALPGAAGGALAGSVGGLGAALGRGGGAAGAQVEVPEAQLALGAGARALLGGTPGVEGALAGGLGAVHGIPPDALGVLAADVEAVAEAGGQEAAVGSGIAGGGDDNGGGVVLADHTSRGGGTGSDDLPEARRGNEGAAVASSGSLGLASSPLGVAASLQLTASTSALPEVGAHAGPVPVLAVGVDGGAEPALGTEGAEAQVVNLGVDLGDTRVGEAPLGGLGGAHSGGGGEVLGDLVDVLEQLGVVLVDDHIGAQGVGQAAAVDGVGRGEEPDRALEELVAAVASHGHTGGGAGNQDAGQALEGDDEVAGDVVLAL
eukprot:199351_1